MKKLVMIFCAIPIVFCLLIGLYFFENIKGYYRFKYYCETDGGLRIYKKLERGLGFSVNDSSESLSLVKFEGVGFVRFYENGVAYDLKYISGKRSSRLSYEKTLASKESVKYLWVSKINLIDHVPRLYEISYEIYDNDNNLNIIFKNYNYSFFERNKTLLAAPSNNYCSNLGGNFESIISTIFEN